MAIDFRDFLNLGEDIGAFDVLLPFILVFTLVFAVLQKSKIFGDKNKNLNVVISFVVGLLFIRNQALVTLVNRFLPNVSLFLIIILMFLLLIGIFAGQHKGWTGSAMGVAAIISIIFIIYSLSSATIGDTFNLPDFLTDFDDQTKGTILFIAVFVIIIWLVTKEPKQEGKEGLLERLGKEIKGQHE